MAMRSYAGVVASAWALAACGGEAKDTATHTGPITDGGSGRGTASGGSSGQGGASGAGARSTASGGTAGSGGAHGGGTTGSGGAHSTGAAGRDGSVDQLECTVKDDHATIDIVRLGRADGGQNIDVVDMDGGDQRRDATFEGVVRQVDVTSFVLDTCPPNADCLPSPVRVTIAAPDLTLIGTGLATGSLARVHLVSYCFYGCHATILVTSLKTWGGLTNQWPPFAGDMYVAADEGGGVLPEAPYKWDSVRLPCRTSFEGGCGGTDEPAGVYALRFDGDVVVPMGQYGYIPIGGGGSLEVRNLRSYVSGACDDYWNYAHWATSVQFGD